MEKVHSQRAHRALSIIMLCSPNALTGFLSVIHHQKKGVKLIQVLEDNFGEQQKAEPLQ